MPPSTKNSRTSYLANRRQPTVRNPPTTPKITLPSTPTITLPTTPTPTRSVRTPPTRSVRTPPTPKITLSTSTEPKLTLPTYSTGGFTSNQKNQTQTTANNNYSQEDNFLKKYPQILLVIPLIIILSKNK